MESFISSWIFLLFTVLIVNVLCNPLTSSHATDVTFAELEDLGLSCHPSDTCQGNETNFGFSCDCDSSCSMYETCCVDSEFRAHKSFPKHKSNLKCLEVYKGPGFEIFMVDSCKHDDTFDNLCFSNPEESNDPFLIIPVTSNLTGITYKNYFCAVCNEDLDSDQLHFWEMQIWGNGTQVQNLSDPQFKYDKTVGSWTAIVAQNSEALSAFPVTLKIQQNLQATVKYCSSDLIGNCSSNWTDEAVAMKCRDYMGIVVAIPNIKYKNAHCALCNFEDTSNLLCYTSFFTAGPFSSFVPASAFSPVDIPLLNLFVLEDRKKRCGRNMVYDKFADKCRCNSRIYTKQNGKCVYKI